jgi:multimeric flavodoxin WrbA
MSQKLQGHLSGDSVEKAMKSFLDRAFFASSVNGGLFRHKFGAAISAVRRSGAISSP